MMLRSRTGAVVHMVACPWLLLRSHKVSFGSVPRWDQSWLHPSHFHFSAAAADEAAALAPHRAGACPVASGTGCPQGNVVLGAGWQQWASGCACTRPWQWQLISSCARRGPGSCFGQWDQIDGARLLSGGHCWQCLGLMLPTAIPAQSHLSAPWEAAPDASGWQLLVLSTALGCHRLDSVPPS